MSHVFSVRHFIMYLLSGLLWSTLCVDHFDPLHGVARAFSCHDRRPRRQDRSRDLFTISFGEQLDGCESFRIFVDVLVGVLAGIVIDLCSACFGFYVWCQCGC